MLRMWTYDLAREQCPTLDHLRLLLQTTKDGGYDSFGLYMEHRFAYPSAPWAAGKGAVTPEMVSTLRRESPEIAIVPFVNLLGHCEGFLYSEEGAEFAEERFKGMQGCPSEPAFREFAMRLLGDVLEAFDSPLVHIGGDEAQQLGACPKCRAETEAWDAQGKDGKAEVYGRWIGEVARAVVAAGRRPAIWGDMLLAHPSAASHLPPETLVFHWEYFDDIVAGARQIAEMGFEVVLCPTLHTYNAPWLHLEPSISKAMEAEAAASEFSGYCLTTWEAGLFGNYETMLPILRGESGEDRWSQIMGVDLPALDGVFGFGRIRSALKCRFLLYGNPFLLWLRHREELVGEPGTRALALLDHAISVAPDAAHRGVSEFVRLAIEFVRHVEAARTVYRDREPGKAAAELAPCRQIFEHLEKIANATHHRIGGSLADVERCRVARQHVETVIRRIRDYGDGSLGYLPSFETITHPKFMPHDQGNWWLINKWANE